LNEKLKRTAVELVQRTDLRKFALNILRKYPKVKEFYTIPTTIDFQRTIAHCSDMSGLKSYTYGGIIVQKNKSTNNGYEKIRDDIIDLLRIQTLPSSAEKLFEWVERREDVYQGEFITKYPDILFKLNQNYGAGWAINVPLFTSTSAHSFFPGTHRGDTPILFVSNINPHNVVNSSVDLVDIAPTILEVLNVDSTLILDGSSFILQNECCKKGLK
jgi:predicted AlkP superfamily phosphohydrolase/phosphomutase